MRWIVLSLLLVVSVATATELTAYQQWLSFTQGAAFNAAGPARMYAAQDMKELQPGSAAYLRPAKELSALKWSTQPASDAVVRVEKRWADIDTLLFLLKDRTSGKSTYGGGRVIEVHIPRGAPPAAVTINLNMAYSFLCAHSEFYNCPIALTDRLDAALPYGEKYPPL